MDFLRESHPERLKDNRFTVTCAEAATEAYEQAIRNGDTPSEAAEQANAVLYNGLHFSKHDTLKNILWNEFAGEVPEDEAGEWAVKLLPECEAVFAGNLLTEGFALLVQAYGYGIFAVSPFLMTEYRNLECCHEVPFLYPGRLMFLFVIFIAFRE
jgi:hypothetical protein